MKNLTRSVSDEIAAEIVETVAAVYWTPTLTDDQGKEVPNVSKEVLTQKLLTEHCRKFVDNCEGILANRERAKIPKREW